MKLQKMITEQEMAFNRSDDKMIWFFQERVSYETYHTYHTAHNPGTCFLSNLFNIIYIAKILYLTDGQVNVLNSLDVPINNIKRGFFQGTSNSLEIERTSPNSMVEKVL